MFFAFENYVVAVNFDYLFRFDEAGEAASIGVAEEGTGVDYKVT
jgi:hypothetical protein